MKILSKISLVLILGLNFIIFSPLTVSAQTCDPTTTQGALGCGAQGGSGTTPGAQDPAGTLNSTIATGLNILSAFTAAVAVILLAYAGFKFVSSAGNEQGIKDAKSIVTYAVVGLIIAALAQIIVHFVLLNLGNATS